MNLATWCQSLEERTIDDRYQILGRLGIGGMSAVMKARHLHTQKIVALKMAPDDQPHFVTRLQREARALGTCQAFGFVHVHDAGHDKTNELWYLAEDFLHGSTLRQTLTENGPFEATQAIDLLVPVMESLCKLHAECIVHRDIKLANLMLTDSKRLKLIDFGLVQFLGEHDKAGVEEKVFGSPSVMSPEQLRGEPVGPETDIWAVGANLYTMITGKSLFEAETLEERFRAILHRKIPSIQETNPLFSSEFASVLLRSMARSLRERYCTMIEFLRDLQQCSVYQPLKPSGSKPVEVEKSVMIEQAS